MAKQILTSVDLEGDLTLKAQGDVRFADSDSSNYVALQAPATVAVNNTYTLPTAYPSTNGQILSCTTAGVMSWATDQTSGGLADGDKGDITVSNSGATWTVDNGLAVSKLANGTARQLLQTNAAGTGVEWTSDVAIPSTLSVPLGTAALPSLYFTGDTNTGIWSPAADTLAVSTGGNERLRVDSAGKVGIGTSSPEAYLDVASSVNTDFAIRTTVSYGYSSIEIRGHDYLSLPSYEAAALYYYSSGNTGTIAGVSKSRLGYLAFQNASNALIATNGATPLIFATLSTERLRIDSSGKVGIGTSSPGYALDVKVATGDGNVAVTGGTGGAALIRLYPGGAGSEGYNAFISYDAVGAEQFYLGGAGNSNTLIVRVNGGVERFRVNTDGQLLVGTTTGNGRFHVSGAQSSTALSTTKSHYIATGAGTFTDTSTAASGTVTHGTINSFDNPAIAATNACTYTNASTVYIDGAPTQGTNVTITNPYSLFVAAGTSFFGGATQFRAANAIRSEAAATQDAIVLAGRAGGTSSFAVTITPTTLGANRTLTLPDATTTVVGTDVSQTLTNKILQPSAGTTTAGTAPIKFTSGTNLTAIEAGALEYDGTTIWATPSTNYGRASIPTTIYTSGAGTTLTQNAETTNTVLFPAANDTITLPIGTYRYNLIISMTRGASATSAFLRIRLGGAGTAVGTFSGHAYGSGTDGGAVNMFRHNGVALNTDLQIGPASVTSGSVQESVVTGILRITTAGTFIPGYSLSALLNVAAVALPASNSLTLQSIATSGSAASTGAWA